MGDKDQRDEHSQSYALFIFLFLVFFKPIINSLNRHSKWLSSSKFITATSADNQMLSLCSHCPSLSALWGGLKGKGGEEGLAIEGPREGESVLVKHIVHDQCAGCKGFSFALPALLIMLFLLLSFSLPRFSVCSISPLPFWSVLLPFLSPCPSSFPYIFSPV